MLTLPLRTRLTSWEWLSIVNLISINKSRLFVKKVNNQLNVVIRFRKLVTSSTMLKLYKAFVLPHFQYCSVAWHFFSSRNGEKLESLNKRALRVVFNDRESTYSQLLDRAAATSLYNPRVQNMLITIHKCIHINFYSAYLKDLLESFRSELTANR